MTPHAICATGFGRGSPLGQGWLDHRAIVDVPTGNKPLLDSSSFALDEGVAGMLITLTIAAGAAQAIHDAGIPVVVYWPCIKSGEQPGGTQRRPKRRRATEQSPH